VSWGNRISESPKPINPKSGAKAEKLPRTSKSRPKIARYCREDDRRDHDNPADISPSCGICARVMPMWWLTRAGVKCDVNRSALGGRGRLKGRRPRRAEKMSDSPWHVAPPPLMRARREFLSFCSWRPVERTDGFSLTRGAKRSTVLGRRLSRNLRSRQSVTSELRRGEPNVGCMPGDVGSLRFFGAAQPAGANRRFAKSRRGRLSTPSPSAKPVGFWKDRPNPIESNWAGRACGACM